MSSRDQATARDNEGASDQASREGVQGSRELSHLATPTAAARRAHGDPGSLTPGDVLQLQRTIGNRAVSALLAPTAHTRSNPVPPAPLVTASAPPAVIQRNEKSTELLKEMAIPKTFAGPQVEVQKQIVEALEKELVGIDPSEKLSYSVTCLGGVVLNAGKGDSLEALTENSELIDLPASGTKDPRSRAIGISTYAMARKAGVEKKIILNTLATMNTAGQLDYLRESGLLASGEWEIVVEIHYYRERSTSQTKLHKDTLGQTLFVNLNYVNEAPIQGPEFILNPYLGEKSMGRTYLDYMKEKLPEEFIKDVEEVKSYYGEPTEIGMSEIPAYGVVAFVDEAIHHKTPTMGHRTVSSWYIADALGKTYPKEYADAKQAYERYNKQWIKVYNYASYFNDIPLVATPNAWYTILDAIQNPSTQFDRKKLRAILPAEDFLDIEALIEKGGEGDFGEATLNHAKRQKIPVKLEGRKPLKRQMSQKLLEGYEPLTSAGPRRFFRTWVRAVRKSK